MPLGFRYRRSKPSLVRREGDFLHEISFHSSDRNIIIPDGERDTLMQALQFYGQKHRLSLTPELIDTMVQSSVTLQITVSTRSGLMKEWRRQQLLPLRNDDYVAGDEIGRLRLPSSVAHFNPGPIETRKQSIVEATVLLQDVALPFFNLFRKSEDLVTRLVEEDLPGFWEAPAFEYVLCFGGWDQGLALLARYLRDRDVEKRFAELLPVFRTERWRQLSLRQLEERMPLGGHAERAGRLAQIAVAYSIAAGKPPGGHVSAES